MPPDPGCPRPGPPSPEVTGAICRVPSTPFSQAPRYALPVHLCRFGVRSDAGAISRDGFTATGTPRSPHHTRHPSHPSRPRNIHLVPIGYGFRPRLRGRLTLRGLALRRNPWTCGESVSHTLYRYSCQHSHFRCLQQPSQAAFTGLRNAPLPSRGQKTGIRDQIRGQTGPIAHAIPAASWQSHDTHHATRARSPRRYSQDRGNIATTPASRRPSPAPSADNA